MTNAAVVLRSSKTVIKQQPEELPEENVPKHNSGTFKSAEQTARTPRSLNYGDTMPRKCLCCRTWLDTG